MSYTAEDIQRFQSIIDSSDPFLVESLHGKTLDELEKLLQQIMREKDVIPKENYQWMERQDSIIRTVSAMIDMKKGYSTTDNEGGVSLV